MTRNGATQPASFSEQAWTNANKVVFDFEIIVVIITYHLSSTDRCVTTMTEITGVKTEPLKAKLKRIILLAICAKTTRINQSPELECDLVCSLRASAAAIVVESLITPVLVTCSGKFFIMFTSAAAAAECSRAADIRALSTPDDDDSIFLDCRGLPSDDVTQPYDVSGDSMTSQRDMTWGEEGCRLT